MIHRIKMIFGATVLAMFWPFNAANALWWGTYGSWDTQTRRDAADAALLANVTRFNAYGDFNWGSDGWVDVYYNASVPTANASWAGAMTFGGTWPAERVAMHELNHWLGSVYGHPMDGPRAIATLEQFDGVGERFGNDGTHFWPYGMNYDNEWSEVGAQRNVAIMYALRDWGIGPTSNPAAWATKTVSLSASDPVGTSGFNYGDTWSDKTFAHPNADYFTGNYAIRSPASGSSFNFAGNSLTINNRSNPSAGLYFKGTGSSSVVTINNLILDGGTVHHFSNSGDLFQLDGKMTVMSASTITPEQGNINILSDVIGLGPLTIGDSAFNVRLLSSNNNFKGNINVNGRFQLLDNANLTFAIRPGGLSNAITGAGADAVLLDGDFELDLGRVTASPGDFWTLVSSANTTYGSNFTVAGFTENSPGLWGNIAGYLFSESNGRLTFGAGSSAVAFDLAVPEPSSLILVALTSLGILPRRRRGR